MLLCPVSVPVLNSVFSLSLWKGSWVIHVDLCIPWKHASWDWRDSHHASGYILPGWLFQRRKHTFLFGLVAFHFLLSLIVFMTFYTLSTTLSCILFIVWANYFFHLMSWFLLLFFCCLSCIIIPQCITFLSLLYPPACIHTVGILGPMFGFLMGSFIAKIYVDIGFVDLGMRLLHSRKRQYIKVVVMWLKV